LEGTIKMMTIYKIKNTVIYCDDKENNIHYVTDSKWELYMELRNRTPSRVIIFTLFREMKKELIKQEYYI
jgi:hypothetical protein